MMTTTPVKKTKLHVKCIAVRHWPMTTQKPYTNATGKFPVQAYNGSQYVLLTYVYNANAFLVLLLHSRSKEDMTNIIKSVYGYLEN